MHAVVVHTDIDMERWPEALAGTDQVKARLSSMDGFEGADWLMPIDGRGLMISRWRDEDAARAAAPPVGFSPAPGVTVTAVEVREVINRA
ncbi:MAG: hypothetical protein KGJ36_01065 [Acidobacteriota bacterium]|nr:hypothetical protein [Acidobacteriota bacterium]